MATRVETLTPNGTISNAWTVTGPSAHQALSDGSDATFIESSTNAQVCTLDFNGYTLKPNEFVSGVRIRLRGSTPSGNHLIGATPQTAGGVALGGFSELLGAETFGGSLQWFTSRMFPGAGDPFAANAADRGAMLQTMLNGLRLAITCVELAAEAGNSRVTEVALDLYISDREPTVVRSGGSLLFSDSGTLRTARLWGVNYRTSLFHHQPAGQIVAELGRFRDKGFNLFRIHVETTKIKTAAGDAAWVNLELAKLVEVLQWMNDNGCYADLTLNATYSSNQAWLESQTEAQRWDERRIVARKVAGMFVDHPAVAYYCLLNEGAAVSGVQTFWRAGDTTGSDQGLFVESLVKDPLGRTFAQQWSDWIADIMSAVDGLRLVNPGAVVVGSGSFHDSANTIRPAMIANGAMGLDATYPHLYPSTAGEWIPRMVEEKSLGLPVICGEFYPSLGELNVASTQAVYQAHHDVSAFVGHSSEALLTDETIGDTNYVDNVRFHAPTAWVRLHELSGAVAEDSSLYPYGGPNDGTIINGPVLGGPKEGMAFAAAQSEWVSLPTLTPVAAAFLNSSYEAWVKTTSAAQGTACGTFSTGTIGAAALYVNRANNGGTVAGSIECQLRGANAGNVVASTGDIDINDGNWHHIVLVITGATTVQFYFDGAAVAPTYHVQQTMTNATFDFGMGVGALNLRGTPSVFLTGSLRDVAFYPRRLTAGEVDAHYKAATHQLTGVLAIRRGIMHWYEDRGFQYRENFKVNMAAGSWQPAATVTVFPASGSVRQNPVASGAAAADGSLVFSLPTDNGQPLVAVGLGPNGQQRVVSVYGSPRP